jgi:luciferase family oxidoreductase group 1
VPSVPLSVLDLATIGENESASEALHGCVLLAQQAERHGYTRVWYAEHHNFESIASSSPAVLIAHVAAHTTSIRLGAGGVMLPNHSPLVIAEQFGTLAALHPGRIDLGLGRAPGTDQNTMRALRRHEDSAANFPRDVVELRGYFTDQTIIPHVNATPGRGTQVPLYILGSSLFGAQLAAMLGLPFAFASHFAPQMLHEAISIYREQFTPSTDLEKPHVIASLNVIAADSDQQAQRELEWRRRAFTRAIFSSPGHRLSDSEVDAVLSSPRSAYIDSVFTYVAMGTPSSVSDYVKEFQRHTGADEIMTAHQTHNIESRLRSIELLADSMGLVAV